MQDDAGLAVAAPAADRPPPKPLAPFVAIWSTQALSLLGSYLVQFSLIWYLTVSTGSATVLAMASLAGFLPQVLVGPFAGALVDRWNRRAVMIVADAAIALSTVLLAVLFAFGSIAVWHIYVLLAVRAVGGAFHQPSMTASTTLMVPVQHLSRVAGMNQALHGVASVAVPPAGALLLGLLPMQGILAIDVVTALVAIGALAFVAIPQPDVEASGEPGEFAQARPSMLADMKAALLLLWSWPGMLLIALMGVVIRLLVGPGVALLPILVTRHFGGGVLELASMQATAGVGMIVGGLALGVWGGFRRRIVTAMVALTLDGLAILTLGLAPADGFALALGAVLVAGIVEPLVNGSLGALAQALIPPAMQGRVFGLVGSATTAMVPLGLAIAGPLADVVGVQIWFVIGGAVTAAMGAGAFLVPAIMRVESSGPSPARAR